jgi:hypothetical protein
VALQLNYGAADRLLHKVAFASPSIQLAAADIEKTLFGASYAGARGSRPIFITSLPRAGTTLMLEALHTFPSLASHLYRDMPFVMAPVLWSRLSGAYRKPATLQERAHGDGMDVGYDSPEAFEEIIWRTFWPGKFRTGRIELWTPLDDDAEARAFFAEHMKKIIALRRPARLADGRYVSKNNANVARLEFIRRMFPDARILVPVRRPLEHARSLLRQHRNFLEMHHQSRFVREYMGDIGHYEFGELHRPIAFPGLDALLAGRDPLTIDYWLAYWVAAFEYIQQHAARLVLVSYEGACGDAAATLTRLCEQLEIPEEGALPGAAALFRAEPRTRAPQVEADPALEARARALHEALVGGS